MRINGIKQLLKSSNISYCHKKICYVKDLWKQAAFIVRKSSTLHTGIKLPGGHAGIGTQPKSCSIGVMDLSKQWLHDMIK